MQTRLGSYALLIALLLVATPAAAEWFVHVQRADPNGPWVEYPHAHAEEWEARQLAQGFCKRAVQHPEKDRIRRVKIVGPVVFGNEPVIDCEVLAASPSIRPTDGPKPASTTTPAPPSVVSATTPISKASGRPTLDELAQNPKNAFKKVLGGWLKKALPVADAGPAPSPAPGNSGNSSNSDNAMSNQPGKLVTTSTEILPIVLPLHKGLPLSRINSWSGSGRPKPYTEDPIVLDQINMQRWFALMHLAKYPKALEDKGSALSMAAANLPGAKWDEYLRCDPVTNCDRQVQALGGLPGLRNMVVWQGKDAAGWERSQKAFADRYGPLLISQATALPQEIYVATTGSLHHHSPAKGGLPLSRGGFLDAAGARDGPKGRLKLAGGYSATVDGRLPEVVKCSPSQCKAILDQVKSTKSAYVEYPVYLLVKVKVSSVQASSIGIGPDLDGVGQPNSRATLLGDLEVYADKALRKKLISLPANLRGE